MKRQKLDVDSVRVHRKAGAVGLSAVLELHGQICLLIAGLQFLIRNIRHAESPLPLFACNSLIIEIFTWLVKPTLILNFFKMICLGFKYFQHI